MTVAELERSMSAREFREWLAYDRIEPFGAPVDELRTGILAATVVNAQPRGKKGGKAAKPEDFMPAFQASRRAAAQTPVASGLDPKRIRADFFSVFGDRMKRKGDGSKGGG